MKQEMEMALRILEKDIHEKQDTMISLRQQLEDIKGINLEMYKKLQVGFNRCKLIYLHVSKTALKNQIECWTSLVFSSPAIEEESFQLLNPFLLFF